LLVGCRQEQRGRTPAGSRSTLARARQIGPTQGVDRFLTRCAEVNTKRAYSYQLWRYFEWLKTDEGVTMKPDELVLDNLRCVFEGKTPA
jgi:hypothetical protein